MPRMTFTRRQVHGEIMVDATELLADGDSVCFTKADAEALLQAFAYVPTTIGERFTVMDDAGNHHYLKLDDDDGARAMQRHIVGRPDRRPDSGVVYAVSLATGRISLFVNAHTRYREGWQ